MELLAILSAMCSVPDGSDIIINTDSKYCICVLSKRQPRRNKPNADLINKCIARMRKLRSIRFVWVKGHNGNEYNELVDHMANEQTELMRKQNGIPVYNYWNSPKVRRSC